MTNTKTVEYKNIFIISQKATPMRSFLSLFCKLNIRDLLFSIKGISSFEKVPK